MPKTMRRKYICTNNVVEVTQFVVGEKQTGGRKWHRAKSQEDKRDENARQAVRVAARILNCNYTSEDVLLTLTYSDEKHERLFDGLGPDEIWEKAKKVLSGKVENARKEFKRADSTANLEMRTFCVTADMDQQTGELVRVHHHVVVTSEAADFVEARWNCGLVHRENLYRQDDYTPLAAYLLGQVRHFEGKKKYSTSRNMVKPIVEEQVLEEVPENEIKVQPGAKVLDRTPYREGLVSQYVRYKRRKKMGKKGGHKEGLTDWGTEISACGGTEIRHEKAEGGPGFEFQEIKRG